MNYYCALETISNLSPRNARRGLEVRQRPPLPSSSPAPGDRPAEASSTCPRSLQRSGCAQTAQFPSQPCDRASQPGIGLAASSDFSGYNWPVRWLVLEPGCCLRAGWRVAGAPRLCPKCPQALKPPHLHSWIRPSAVPRDSVSPAEERLLPFIET